MVAWVNKATALDRAHTAGVTCIGENAIERRFATWFWTLVSCADEISAWMHSVLWTIAGAEDGFRACTNAEPSIASSKEARRSIKILG
jgi:hypothetical protein